jgi:hypothetical protein
MWGKENLNRLGEVDSPSRKPDPWVLAHIPHTATDETVHVKFWERAVGTRQVCSTLNLEPGEMTRSHTRPPGFKLGRLESLAERVSARASVKNVYGEPVILGNRTAIRVAQGRYEFVGGGGHPKVEEAPASSLPRPARAARSCRDTTTR